MIPWKMAEEKEIVLFYANILNDTLTTKIIEHGDINNKEEALHLAEFFWIMVNKSNEIQFEANEHRCEYLLEKVIITFMAYFRSAGYEAEWERFADM